MAETIRKVVEIDIDVKSGEVKILDRELNNVLKTTKKLNSQQKAQGELQSKTEGIVDRLTGGLFSQAKQWFQMGKTAVTALTGIKSGLVSTGIGALVVGLGLVVAYWDEIVAFIGDGNDEMQDLIDLQDEYTKSVERSERANKIVNDELRRMGFSELDIKKKLIADEKKLTKQAEAAANLAFNTVERLKKERLESSKSIFGMLFEGPSEEDIATAEGIFNDLEKKSETHQEKLKAYIYEKKQLELAAEDEITAANQTEYDKRLQLTRKYLDLKSMLDQAHQLAIIEDDKERQLKQLEFAKENDIKSIEQSEFTEKRKADLKERYERQWLDKKTKLTEQWRKEDEARFQGYLDEANKNREDNETEYFKDLENIREEIRQSGLSDEQLEIEAAQAKYFRLIELAEEYGEDVTDLETAQAKAVADIEKKYANQIKQDKILATQASLDVAARATTSLMMMNDALVDHGLITAKKGFQIAKGVAIAEATISTANAAISAYKSVVGVPYVGPILAPIAAGVAVAAGGAQIAMISAQTFDGGGGGAVSSPSAGGGASTQSAGGGGAPQFNTVGTSGFNQVAGSIANQNQEPIKAYVVANDVTSQQSLDRNSRDKSSF